MVTVRGSRWIAPYILRRIMKIKFIRKYRGKKIGTIEEVENRVAYRFVNKGMAKFVIEKPKRKTSKKNVKRWNS